MDIDQKTTVSLFAVIAALPFIIGALLWLSAVASDAKEAKAQTTDLKSLVLDVRERVIRIEEHQKQKGE